MGEKTRETLKLQFDKRLRLEFQGARITSDAGLLACRELDEALGLTEVGWDIIIGPDGGEGWALPYQELKWEIPAEKGAYFR